MLIYGQITQACDGIFWQAWSLPAYLMPTSYWEQSPEFVLGCSVSSTMQFIMISLSQELQFYSIFSSIFMFACVYFATEDILETYFIPMRLVCLSGSLGSSASVQMFCGSCSTCRLFFDIFVREKIFSPSYSSAILKVLLIIWFVTFN